jgi:O-antigen/teichoic acid export membrane protein
MSSLLARNSALNIAAGLATITGAFLSNVVVARLLGLEGTGIVAFATWLAMMASTAIDLGVSGALARYIPELGRDRAVAAGLVWFLFKRIALSALLVCASLVFYGLLLRRQGAGTADGWSVHGDFAAEPLLWLLVALAGVGQALTGFVNGALQGFQDFGRMARVAIWSAGLRLAASAALASAIGIAGALLAPLAAAIPPLALLPGLLLGPSVTTAPNLGKRVRRFMWQSWASYVLTAFVASRMEIAFLQLSWGSKGVSLYAVGMTFANLATNGTLLLSGALLPYLSQLSRADAARAHAAYSGAMRMIAFLVFPACLGMAAILPRLLPLLYGAQFADAVPAGVLLVCAGTANAVSTITFIYLMAMERTQFLFVTGLIGTSLMILAGLTAVPAFGPEGAAASRAVVILVIASINVWYIRSRLHCPTPLAALGRLLAAAVLCALAARLSLSLLTGPASLALAIIAGAAAFAGAIRWLGAVNQADAAELMSVAELLPEPLRAMLGVAVRALSGRSAPEPIDSVVRVSTKPSSIERG